MSTTEQSVYSIGGGNVRRRSRKRPKNPVPQSVDAMRSGRSTETIDPSGKVPGKRIEARFRVKISDTVSPDTRLRTGNTSHCGNARESSATGRGSPERPRLVDNALRSASSQKSPRHQCGGHRPRKRTWRRSVARTPKCASRRGRMRGMSTPLQSEPPGPRIQAVNTAESLPEREVETHRMSVHKMDRDASWLLRQPGNVHATVSDGSTKRLFARHTCRPKRRPRAPRGSGDGFSFGSEVPKRARCALSQGRTNTFDRPG
jgi:hypothetical protein